MKWLLSFLLFICSIYGYAQVIENPVFDRTDTPNLHIQKIEITKDTTFIFCTYSAEEGSWANISPNTYLEEVKTGKKITILKCDGLPFAPQYKDFISYTYHFPVKLSFPHIDKTTFNLIENPNSSAFNIYGINLNKTYSSKYSEEDIQNYRDLAVKEENNNNWRSAIDYTLKQLEATMFFCGIHSGTCSLPMYNLTMQYFETKEYDKVIEWGEKIVNILNEIDQDTTALELLARTYGNISTAFFYKGNKNSWLEYQEKSLNIRRIVGNRMNTYNYEQYLSIVIKNLYDAGNYPKALLYGKELADICKMKYSENKDYICDYVQTLSNLCEFYSIMGKNEEAILCGNRALELVKSDSSNVDEHRRYSTYNNLAGALLRNNQIKEGVNLLKKILTAGENRIIDNEGLLIATRQQLAGVYLYHYHDSVKAVNLFKQNLNIIESGRGGSGQYADVLHSLYSIYRKKKESHDLAMQYLNKAIITQKEWTGEGSIAYADLLVDYLRDTWIDALDKNKGLDTLFHYIRKSSEIIKRHLNNTIYNMSKSDRQKYWYKYEDMFTWLIPTVSGILHTQESNCLAYDAALFYKGMLLSSENEIKKISLSSNDSTISELYNDYVNNLSHIEKEYAQRSSSIIIDSLSKIIQKEEYLLSQKITRFNKTYKGTNYTWKDVQERLDERDVAIEIVSYKSIGGKDIYYDAYVIKKDFDAPLMIPLCSENNLLECFSNDTIDYEKLSITIWNGSKFAELFKGVRNIYFSTSGLLNTIAMEYLPVAGNQHMSDIFNLYRLSSTKELCTHINSTDIKKVCLYGGLDYNSVKQNNIDDYVDDAMSHRVLRAVYDSIIKRGGFDPLAGSKQEIEQINQEMVKSKIECRVFTDLEGTEESFKKLSGSLINIIHLSTHGMYVSNNDNLISKNNNYHFILSEDIPNVEEESQSLSRSFLVMSGGNMLVHRDSIPLGKDDGILTALEISHLDFQDLDLVIMSACQTALGKIESDGVFGLQRAFKKAGSNTILMSIDNVDDEATRILMVEFYRNLVGGKTKYQSLKNAQKYLRNVENGKFDDPKYWASFIMLDGLN